MKSLSQNCFLSYFSPTIAYFAVVSLIYIQYHHHHGQTLLIIRYFDISRELNIINKCVLAIKDGVWLTQCHVCDVMLFLRAGKQGREKNKCAML